MASRKDGKILIAVTLIDANVIERTWRLEAVVDHEEEARKKNKITNLGL